MKRLLICLVLTFGLSPASAMEFRLSGKKLLASGVIVPGDANRFAGVVAGAPREETTDAPDVVVSLESPGGTLLEGIRLGLAIRDARVGTVVERGKTCASACAVAYLGGKVAGIAASAISRRLEPGASLAFHGFSFAGEDVQVANETLAASRIMTALVIEYATRMGGVDLGALARMMTVAPDELETIRTPRQLRALGIDLAGDPPKPPKGWPRNACRQAVASRLSVLDRLGTEGRVTEQAEPMPNLAAFRRRLLDDKYPEDSRTRRVREAALKLPAGDALDLLAGEALYLEQGRIGAWRVQLERGAGFYFDACYAVTDFQTLRTILIDGVSHATVVQTRDTLAGFPPDTPLW